MTDYWQAHTTVVLTWPAGASVPLPRLTDGSQPRHEYHADGSLSVEYTRDTLLLTLAIWRGIRNERPKAAEAATWISTTTARPRLTAGRFSLTRLRTSAR